MTPKDVLLNEDYTQSYWRQWAFGGLLLGSLAIYSWYQTHGVHQRPAPPVAALNATGDFYYILRMPEMQIHADASTMRQQLTRWIEAMRHEGFQIVLLSDIIRQLHQGQALPEKTVVIVFDPSYRRTVDTYEPVLRHLQVPAVWLTNGPAIARSDKRYVSEHEIEAMKHSGLWDIGLYTPQSGMTLVSGNLQTPLFGLRSPWKQDAGRFALNRGVATNAFDHLNVNAKWTDVDLVHRLLAERPVQGSTLLSSQQIQGRNWGIVLDGGATNESRFTLRAPSDKRSGSLYWLGTLGIQDLHLRLEVKSLIGEMRVLLRSDPGALEDVSITFSRGKVSVDQTKPSGVVHLATAPCPDIAPGSAFTAVLAIMGKQLALAVNDHPLIALETLTEPTSKKGMVRLMVQDSLTGVGEVRSVRIICTPLAKK